MRNVNKLKEETNSPLSPSEISEARMQFVQEHPEVIAKIFEGDPSAIEAFTNFGGIQAKVTNITIKDSN